MSPDAAPPRKGHMRMADIPPDLLARLNHGQEQTRTLVEWLAIDVRLLAHEAARLCLPDSAGKRIVAASHALATEGVTVRSKGMGAAVHTALAELKKNERLKAFDALASHPSDMVRSWAGYSVRANPTLSLPERLRLVRRFAADQHMSVRECAWDALRPAIAAELDVALKLLSEWVNDEDEGVRRCAIEATRPRGVWCLHIDELKREPARAAHLLEAVRSDESRYVARSCANWLNDASKSQPAWVMSLTKRWVKESPTKQTKWLVNHATRSLRKKG
jgi:3-methyladenine DNA glycosylase AlkC